LSLTPPFLPWRESRVADAQAVLRIWPSFYRAQTSVHGVDGALLFKGDAFIAIHWGKLARDPQILHAETRVNRFRLPLPRLEDSLRNESHRPRGSPLFHGIRSSVEALHSDCGDSALLQLGQYALLKGAKVRIKSTEWQLTGVERKITREHVEMDFRIFVPVKPMKRTLPCFFASVSASIAPPGAK
jgi:hypothetical protein